MKSVRFAVLFWLGVTGLVLVSLIPNVSLPGVTIDSGVTVRVSKEMLAHLLGCALLAWFYVKAYGVSVKGVVFMLLLAVASEVTKYLFTVNRNIEIGDLAYNIAGVAFGMSIEWIGKFVKGVGSGRVWDSGLTGVLGFESAACRGGRLTVGGNVAILEDESG